MAPGTMSSLAVASTVSRSATGSKGLRFVADAAVSPKEHATATTSAKIRVVMISLLGHADELTVGPPTSCYGTSGNIETSVVCPHPEIAPLPERMPGKPPCSESSPSACRRAGVTLQKKRCREDSDAAQRRGSLGRSLCRCLRRAGGGGCVGAASRHRRALDRHAEIGPAGLRPVLRDLPPAAADQRAPLRSLIAQGHGRRQR